MNIYLIFPISNLKYQEWYRDNLSAAKRWNGEMHGHGAFSCPSTLPLPPPPKKKVSNRGLKSDKVSLKLRKNNIFSQKTKKRKYFVPGNGKKLQKIYENKKKPNIFATSLAGKKWIAKPGYITQQQENMPWTTWGRNSQILERGSGGYRRLCTLQAYQTYRCLSWKHLLQSTVQIGIGTQASADKNESTLSLQCYMVEKLLN